MPLADHFLDEPDETTVATDLAPSQATGSTVPKPAVPDRCGALDAVLWTAQVNPDGDSYSGPSAAPIKNTAVGEGPAPKTSTSE